MACGAAYDACWLCIALQANALSDSLAEIMDAENLSVAELHGLNSTSFKNKGSNQTWNLFLLTLFGLELLLRLFAYVRTKCTRTHTRARASTRARTHDCARTRTHTVQVSPLTDFYVWIDIVTLAPLIMRISLSYIRQGQSSLTFYVGCVRARVRACGLRVW
jgi:hypothetical protein